MKTSIELPEDYEVDPTNTDPKVVKLRRIQKIGDIRDRIKSVADAIAEIVKGGRLTDADVTDYQILLSVFPSNHHCVKEQQAVLITKALNEGWFPDYDNNKPRYYPRFIGGSSGFRFDGDDDWHSNSGVGSRLAFKTPQLAIHAGKQFTEVYKGFII